MAKHKSIFPALPVCADPGLRAVETLARARIAQIKQDRPEVGKRESLTTTQTLAPLDKIKMGQRTGHQLVHGSPADKAQRIGEIRATYIAMREANPDWKEENVEAETAAAIHKAHPDWKVSARTVRRHKRLGT